MSPQESRNKILADAQEAVQEVAAGSLTDDLVYLGQFNAVVRAYQMLLAEVQATGVAQGVIVPDQEELAPIGSPDWFGSVEGRLQAMSQHVLELSEDVRLGRAAAATLAFLLDRGFVSEAAISAAKEMVPPIEAYFRHQETIKI